MSNLSFPSEPRRKDPFRVEHSTANAKVAHKTPKKHQNVQVIYYSLFLTKDTKFKRNIFSC